MSVFCLCLCVCGKVSTDAMAQLTDATDYDVRRKVAGLAREVPGVVSFDRVRARRMGPQTLVDLTIQTDDMISASAAQQVRCRHAGWGWGGVAKGVGGGGGYGCS